MDDLNISMEEYIELEAEKARRREEFVNEPIVSKPTVKKLAVKTSEAKASADKPKVTHPNAKRNMVPKAVLLKSGTVNAARQSSSKTAVLVNTARQISTTHPKSTVNVARPMSHISKTAHSTVKRPIHEKKTFTNSNVPQKVNNVRSKTVNIARPKAVINVVLGNRVYAVKASACRVWKPKTKLIDLVSKHNKNELRELVRIKTEREMCKNKQRQSDLVRKRIGRNVKAQTVNGKGQLQALVDGKKVLITESTIRRDLQLEDAEGVDCIPNVVIFEQLTLIGTMASIIICLATNQKFNFSKYISESMVKNLDNVNKFLMYLRNMKRVGKGFYRRDTPLFPTMMVQAQKEMGEGSENPTYPHHPPTIIQPSKSQPQKTKQHRKPKRKVTEVPQPSDSTSVAHEAINEEMDDSLERDATTATSLDAECQEAIGDTVVQTSHNKMFLILETTKTTQVMEIESLKKRVKKLKRRKRSRTHGLKRLYKVGLSARVESSEDEGLGKDDASKQGRIADIHANEDIYLVNVHNDEDIFGVNDLDGDEVVTPPNWVAAEYWIRGVLLHGSTTQDIY
nr:hypothetical protein [Tanacetum cinerariifolium]